MSQMSSVYTELCELGWEKVETIEQHVNYLFHIHPRLFTQKEIKDIIVKDYNISENTATMIMAGYKTNKCSKSVRSAETND